METRSLQLGSRLLYVVATIAILLDCYVSRDKGVRFTSIAVAIIFGLAAATGNTRGAFWGRLKELLAAIFIGVLFIKHVF